MKNKISLVALVFIALSLFASTLFFCLGERSDIISGGDSNGYYCYLPAIFIYHDLDNLKQTVSARYLEDHNRYFDTIQQGNILDCSFPKDGKTPVIKYTYGISVLQFPFFYVAHLLAPALHFKSSGYSKIYLLAVQFSLLFYFLFGLWWLRKLLLFDYSDTVTTMVLLSLAFATNAYFFVVKSAPMSHVYLFSLYALLMYAVRMFFKNRGWVSVVLIGFCCGLITVIRPNEITCLFFPLLYGIANIETAKLKLFLLFEERKKIIVAVATFSLPVFFLLLYWKTMSGKWVYDSYPNEHFDFMHPHILEGLFYFSNGWLAYTPAMYLAIAGIPFLFSKKNEWLIPFLFFIPIHIYTIYSWWCWNYINGFGSRPMIETYPLWSIPLAAFFQFIFTKKIWRVIIVALLIPIAAINISQTWQAQKNLMVSELGNFVFVKNILFKTSLTQKDLVEFDCGIEQPIELRKQRELYRYDFEDSVDTHYVRSVNKRGNFSYLVTGDPMYLAGYSQTVAAIGLKKGDWLKGSIWCKPLSGTEVYNQSVLVVQIKRGDKYLQYSIMRLQNKVLNHKTIHPYSSEGEGETFFYVPVPDNIEPSDMVAVYVVASKAPVLIDDVVVGVWK